MNEVRHSKKLSWLLRHGATEEGLAMDPAGWVGVDDVLRLMRIDLASLDELIRTNRKQRIEREGERVRACQGHSLGVPVTHAALEASWKLYTSDATVWHGTHVDAIEGIAQTGITAQSRTHVHLAQATDSTVGKRANVHVMLAISPAKLAERGIALHVAPNGVILARTVPPGCIVELRAETKRARNAEKHLRSLLGLAAQKT